MPQINVTITNAITGERNAPLTLFLHERSLIEAMHPMIEKIHPDCHVSFYWTEGEHNNFILGMPYNMRQDEANLPFDEYVAKWYPEIAGPEFSN